MRKEWTYWRLVGALILGNCFGKILYMFLDILLIVLGKGN